MKTLKDYLKEDINGEELRDMVNNVNSENGYLEQYQVYDFDENTINDVFSSPFEALRSATFGEVSFNDEYFRFNGYGNIETISEYSLLKELEDDKDNIIETWLDYCFDEDKIRDIVVSIDDDEEEYFEKLIEEF
jgi:hypothetical protein